MTNKEYSEKRNALIPLAVKWANLMVSDGLVKTGSKESCRWDEIFHKEMNRLAKERGLV